MSAQMFCKDFFAQGDAFGLIQLGKTVGFKHLRATLDNEGRGVIVELIGVGPNPAMLGLLKDESKCVIEFLVGAQPDKVIEALVYFGLEGI